MRNKAVLKNDGKFLNKINVQQDGMLILLAVYEG
jgi:hypothetical protein